MSLRWVLVLAMLAPCAPTSTKVEPGPVDAAPPNNTGSAHAGKRDASAKPGKSGGCPSPGVRCESYGPTCDDGTTHCVCAEVCSGMELMPEEYYPRWVCQERDLACPDAVPKDGDACRRNGLSCGYGTCGGASATCENKRWSVRQHGPPP